MVEYILLFARDAGIEVMFLPTMMETGGIAITVIMISIPTVFARQIIVQPVNLMMIPGRIVQHVEKILAQSFEMKTIFSGVMMSSVQILSSECPTLEKYSRTHFLFLQAMLEIAVMSIVLIMNIIILIRRVESKVLR